MNNLAWIANLIQKSVMKKIAEINYKHCAKAIEIFYKKSGRHDLPWRKNISPYSILVSELMLQQTQVSRVIPKYNEWMKKYPTLSRLQRATFQELLLMWKGLGYQRRVKALFEIGRLNTALPKTYDVLQKLPGVGSYTAGAIIAFTQNIFIPIVETNIRTVLLHHLYNTVETNIDDNVLRQDIERVFKNSKLSPRDFYYACMDYGSHLKHSGVKLNHKVKGYTKQTTFKGSLRELRAKVLFAIIGNEPLPKDKRLETVLNALQKEKYIIKTKAKTVTGYTIMN